MAKILGLSVKRERTVSSTSLPEHMHDGDQASTLENEDNPLENISEENTETDWEKPYNEDGRNKIELWGQKGNERESIVKSLNSGVFLNAPLPDRNTDEDESREMKKEKVKKTPKEYRTEMPKRKTEGTYLTREEKKLFKESFNTDKARLAKRQGKFNR